MNWPGAQPTAELELEIRHNRFIETIAGYPQIATGKRPLDFPMHYLSIEALKLSLYLDGIGLGLDKTETEWHSLRTFLLDSDLQITTKKNRPCDSNEHLQLLTLLIEQVELFEEIKNADKGKIENFKLDRSNFLRGLHSSAHNRLHFWVLVKTDGVIKSPPAFILDTDGCNHGPLLKNLDFFSSFPEEFYEHSIKFLKIQKWIKEYSEYTDDGSTPLSLNIRHNLHIGASAVLEGIFAKIRSKVLTEKRPGSITIDGGGRLCFISRNTSEKAWIDEIISKSLELDVQHPQPFADVLRNAILSWGINTNRIATGELEQGHKKTFLKHEFSKITKEYYPLWSYNGSEENSPEIGFFKDKQCHICIQSTEYKTESSPERYLDQFPQEHEGHKNQICAFHFLLFQLGEGVKVRQASQKMKIGFDPTHKKIHHVICLDGNGIGQIFNKSWEVILAPEVNPLNISEGTPKTPEMVEAIKENEHNQQIIGELWSSQKKQITDLKMPWFEIIEPFNERTGENFGINDKKQKRLLKKIYNRRMQVHLQRKRRSFCFNAKWWIAFSQGLYSEKNNHLEPFVAAGDDLILVNRASEEIENVVKALESFANCLSQEFNKEIPISFGAGVAAKNSTIAETIKKAEEVEKSAKVRWKQDIQAGNQYGHLIKESARPEVQEKAERLDLTAFEEKFILGEKGIRSVVHISNSEN